METVVRSVRAVVAVAVLTVEAGLADPIETRKETDKEGAFVVGIVAAVEHGGLVQMSTRGAETNMTVLILERQLKERLVVQRMGMHNIPLD